MGKSLLDEHHPLYGGCYAGSNSLDKVREEVESADFVLYVGALKSDFNSGSFSVKIDPKIIIELHSFTTNVGVSHVIFALHPTDSSTPLTPRRTFDTFYLPLYQHSQRSSRRLERRRLTGTRWPRRKRPEWPSRSQSQRGKRSNMLGSGREWENGSPIEVIRCSRFTRSQAHQRYHHHRDWNILFRSDQCRTAIQLHIRRTDSVGCDRMVSWRMFRLRPCCQGI